MAVVFNDLSGNLATISRDPSFRSNFKDDRLNHFTRRTADGGIINYDVGPTVIEGVLHFKNVDSTEADTLRTWIKTKIIYGKNPFTIDISSFTNVNIGAGAGTNLTTCTFPKNTTGGVFTPRPPGNYDVEFPYIQDAT